MERIVRFCLTILLAVTVSALLAGIVVFTYDRIDQSGPPGSDLYFTTSLTIGAMVTVLPAFLTGLLIGVIGLRPLMGMILGIVFHLAPVILIFGWMTMTEKNLDLLSFGEPFTIWTLMLLPVGAVTGAVCGLLSPRHTRKTGDMSQLS